MLHFVKPLSCPISPDTFVLPRLRTFSSTRPPSLPKSPVTAALPSHLKAHHRDQARHKMISLLA